MISSSILFGRARLTSQGHQVFVVDDDTPSASVTSSNFALLIVSSDIASGGITGTGAGVVGPVQPCPYIIYEQAAYGAIFGGGAGNPGGTTINITNLGHPLAAGLSGVVSLNSASGPIPYSTSANVTVVANNGTGGQAALFVLEPNVSNGSTSYADRRIGCAFLCHYTYQYDLRKRFGDYGCSRRIRIVTAACHARKDLEWRRRRRHHDFRRQLGGRYRTRRQ